MLGHCNCVLRSRICQVTYSDIGKMSERQESFIIRYDRHNLWPPDVLIAGKETLTVVLDT